jgi:hypothetical protein
VRKIIDLNCLRRTVLNDYLANGDEGVLFELHFMEMSKGNTVDNLRSSLVNVAKYPGQFFICKSLPEMIQITGGGPSPDPGELIDIRATKNISSFCRHIYSSKVDEDRDIILQGLAAEAQTFFVSNRMGAHQVAEYIKQTLTKRLSSADKKVLRNGLVVSDAIMDWLPTEAQAFTQRLLVEKGYNIKWITSCLAYRYIVAGYLLCLYWIGSGGLESLPIDRLVNDITDMMYVAVATYFDGILTAEKKVKWTLGILSDFVAK